MKIPRCSHLAYCKHKKNSRTWCFENCITKDGVQEKFKIENIVKDDIQNDRFDEENFGESLLPEYLKNSDNDFE